MREQRKQSMILARCLCALTLIALPDDPSFAKGGAFRTEDRYNPQHIDDLPPEIRSAIYRMCSAPKALHPFASYSDGLHRSYCTLSISTASNGTDFVISPVHACMKSMRREATIFS